MSNDEKPGPAATADNLTDASVEAVLLYGLTLDDEDPALGLLNGVRRELGLLASLAELAQPGADLDFAELAPVLEGMGRRIEVALELMDRAKRTRAPCQSRACELDRQPEKPGQ